MPTRGLFEETNKYYSKHQCSAAFSDFCMRFGNILTLVQDDNQYTFYDYYEKLDTGIASKIRKWILILK